MVLELKSLVRTVHVTSQHLHPLAVELAVVETQVVLDVPVELAAQLGSLHHLPARPDPPPALQVQLVLSLPTEVLGHGGPNTDLAHSGALSMVQISRILGSDWWM